MSKESVEKANNLDLDGGNNSRQPSRHEDANENPLEFPWDEEHSGDPADPFQPKSLDVRMFANARNVLIRDTAINNAGGDITIHHHSHFYQEPQGVSDYQPHWYSLLSWRNRGSTMFHLVAETIKKLSPLGFSPLSEIDLNETAAEDVYKYPRLHGVKVVESKTTMCFPGSIIQTLSSIRYSFL
ncbi:hypothetical protein GALMADRAFT_452588 [Galerina marginata CBS 339.88]|uniref:Uncharacterized protein n=1 Tax=Galerina marginata (strain CBS 339.88) TaxID=685588 RepID=A0A067T9Q6_GALM3|nr:hypothetical protein GALMADRAFT_452588 [Galerina marginata CBS 339.88]